MIFNELADKLSPFLLNEKYYSYQPPIGKNGKELLMYDFYVLDYLNTILGWQPQGFRDLSPDLEDSIKDAVNKLYPYLKDELLNVVFYAVCAEMRHAYGTIGYGQSVFEESDPYFKLWSAYLKYIIYHGKTEDGKKELSTVFNVRKPSSDVRVPETEKGNDVGRNKSFKAANYAIKKMGVSRKEFIELSEIVFRKGMWSPSYGGNAWGNICSGWLLLDRSDKINPNKRETDKASDLDKASESEYDKSRRKVEKSTKVEPMGVAIDHVYDLQHNTDTVFNKLKSYYNSQTGYRWIKTALDKKANVKSYYELLGNCSGTVKAMALPVLYNRLGSTWERDIRENYPERLYEHPKEDTTPKPVTLDEIFPEPNQNEKPPSFKVGDIFEYSGVKYKIKSLPNSLGLVAIQNISSPGTDFDIEIEELEDYIAKYEATLPKPKDTTTPSNITTYDPNVYAKVPINDVSDLKIGDLLLCVKEYPHRKNIKLGVVVEFAGQYKYNSQSINVKLNGKVSEGFYISSFVKLVPKNQGKDHKDNILIIGIKVGDMVKCIDDTNTFVGSSIKLLTLNKIYKVLETTSNLSHVSVIDDYGHQRPFYTKRFVKVKTPDSDSDRRKEGDYYQSFKVGDIVTPRDVPSLKNSGYEKTLIPGKEYRINGIKSPYGSKSWNYAMLTVDVDGHEIDVYAKRFKLVKKATPEKISQVDSIKKSRPKERLYVGDYVTYKSLSTNKELSGMIISINNGEAYVHFAKQHGLDVSTSEWIHLAKLKKDIKI